MIDYAKARANMVESQIRPNKVTDPAILDAFHQIPREQFVPEALRGIAYVDEDVPLGGGRYLMEPMVLARLVQAAEIKSGDVALDIGCGTGYCAAILSRLAVTVIAVESDPLLARIAETNFAAFGIGNATLVEAPLEHGCAARAPYDVIILGGAVTSIPRAVTDQLGEGGRLVAVEAAPNKVGRLVVMERLHGSLSRREVCDAGTHPLPGFRPMPAFSF